MEIKFWKRLVLFAVLLLQHTCYMTTANENDEQIRLLKLETDKPEYFENETATISAGFQLPENKEMHDYRFNWTVGINTPFIFEKRYVYRDGSSEEDEHRYKVRLAIVTSGEADIEIKVSNLKLTDDRVLKLSVFNNYNLLDEILFDVVTLYVYPRPSSAALRATSTTPKLPKVTDPPRTISTPSSSTANSLGEGSTGEPCTHLERTGKGLVIGVFLPIITVLILVILYLITRLRNQSKYQSVQQKYEVKHKVATVEQPQHAVDV